MNKYNALEALATKAGDGRTLDQAWQNEKHGFWIVGERDAGGMIEMLQFDPTEFYDETEAERLARYYAGANPNAVEILIADVKALAEALQSIADSSAAEDGCFYTNKANISRARAALKRIQEEA